MTDPQEERPSYFSYLLRLWRVTEANQTIWRASLEHPVTGERFGFGSLRALFAYIEQLIVERSSMNEDQPDEVDTDNG